MAKSKSNGSPSSKTKKLKEVEKHAKNGYTSETVEEVVVEKEAEGISTPYPPEDEIIGETPLNKNCKTDGDCGEVTETIKQEPSKLYERSISIIEFAIINNFLFKSLVKKIEGIRAIAHGSAREDSGLLKFGGSQSDIYPWWFLIKCDFIDDDNIIFQTRQYKNCHGQLCHTFDITTKDGLTNKEFDKVFYKFREIAYNNSEYKGKCLKVTLYDGRFEGITILDSNDFNQDIILSDTQKQFLEHYVKRIRRGKTARYLLNGTPGTGKTESIRKIIYELLGDATFIIPEFYDIRDLTQILESCNIFDPGVLIIDDIDLYLGSRDKGNYSSILGQFLSFFDGVKKNKISILASTNDKGLVDKAAERPGRFNMTLDFGYLKDEQIEDVCKIHLDEKWQVKEVFNALKGKDESGNPVQITGAFIANLAENIHEMAEDEEDWGIEETIHLIKETYKGFYSSQIEIGRKKLGFNH
jgi:hypothetical protein